MARQIVILESDRGTGRGDTGIRFLFWFPIPAPRSVPMPGFTGAFTARGVVLGPTAQELADLQSGALLEEASNITVPTGTTQAQIKNALESKYAARAGEIAALPNPNQFYGTSWDGTAWS